jgi:ribonuclease P protein component
MIANEMTFSQAKGRPKRKFPKSARLLTRSHYQFLYKNSVRLFGKEISIDIRRAESPSAKLGITVSRKFGKAHDRNRFKRVVREAFRELYPLLPQNLMLNVAPRRSGICVSKFSVLNDFKQLLSV